MKAQFKLLLPIRWRYSEQIHPYLKPEGMLDVVQRIKGCLHWIYTEKLAAGLQCACVRQMYSEMVEFL